MNKHTLVLMEFKKIVDRLAGYCLSEQGRRLLSCQRIETEKQKVRQTKAITTAFRKLLESSEKFPDFDFPDLVPLYPHLQKKGSFLDPPELLAIANYLVSAKRLKRFILKHSADDNLREPAGQVPEPDEIPRAIYKIIDRHGQVRDNKIPELIQIKKQIRNLHASISGVVRQWLENPEYRTYWQTDTATTRDGRLVLPLKANFRGRIKGIVHEASASGATIFIEPHNLVEKNNALVTCENNYRKALAKVLQELTSGVIDKIDTIKLAVDRISHLDSFYARAVFSRQYNCRAAQPSDKSVKLINARHPLLQGKPVPLNLEIPARIRVLIITGPNTGGKTVSLKTVGLLGMMNQFGMEIPADEGSCLPVFHSILADIGDEQSIEQSLSTFSGHIRNLSRIIKQSTPQSLVLLDELGAGTDPEEGVAIAMAILDHFIAKGCLVMATTHHGILKNFGYTRDGVENASMDFDENSLTPKYRLIMGLPGESHALSIAVRNGIPRGIMQQARAYLDDERSDISELIKRLAEKQKTLIKYEQEHNERKSELVEKERMADLKELRLRQKELEVTEYNIKELKRFLTESRRELENIIRQLREEELTSEKIKDAHRYVGGIEDRVKKEEEKFKKNIKIHYLEPDVELKPGMEVIIKNNCKSGRILRRGKGGSWVVKTGSLKVTLFSHEFEAVAIQRPEEKVEVFTTSSSDNTRPVFMQNLIGLRLSDAIAKLEKQIDAAVINGLKEFSVIHGKGDGILQKGIHQYLKNCSFVEDYFFSTPEGGGFGRTIVVLKG